MDSSRNTNHYDESVKRVENILTEFFSKSLHIILESRSPCSHMISKHDATQTSGKRDTWFNLALRECCPLLKVQDNGIQHSKQMVVDLVLLQEGKSGEGKVIERWVMAYEPKMGIVDYGGLKRYGLSRSRVFYKKCVLMLRSLYVMLKLLPAYKVYRELKVTLEPEVSLVYYVSSFAEPFAREVESEMRRFSFEPVDLFSGRLSTSVMYLPCLQDLRISRPSTIEIRIPDYFCACGSKAYGSGMKPLIKTDSGLIYVTQPQLSAPSPTRSSTREISADGVKIEPVAKCQCSPAPFASTVPSPPALMTICSQNGSSQTKVDKCQNPEENGDPLFAKLSDNAVLGSLVTVFQTAAPLHLSSTVQPNISKMPARRDIPTPSPAVKTALDAFQELQVHINMKNTILARSSILNNSDNQRLVSKSSALMDDGTSI